MNADKTKTNAALPKWRGREVPDLSLARRVAGNGMQIGRGWWKWFAWRGLRDGRNLPQRVNGVLGDGRFLKVGRKVLEGWRLVGNQTVAAGGLDWSWMRS